jgi:putative ABC transport system permease protein
MALPLIYNVESVRARWVSSIVAVLGIAGTVAVFCAMLALAHGFQAAIVASGSDDNAMIRRAGSTSEIDSAITLEGLRAIEDAAEVARGADNKAIVSPEVVVIAALPLKTTGSDANVQARGLGPLALEVHRNVKVVEGRWFQPSLFEMVVGRNAKNAYQGLDVGSKVKLGGTAWTVVGVFDSGGSGFDSEIWMDATLLNPTYQRPAGVHQVVVARLASRDALAGLRERLTSDPRLRVQVDRETEYYRKASRQMVNMITVLGGLVASVMGLGAIFGALNTMYSAVAERTREVATIRALGFGAGAVIVGFVIEALLVAFVGGLVGCLAALPINGITTQTMNWATFSHVAFAFRVTPEILGLGVLFALFMGLLGGIPPAWRAAHLPVAAALRDL